MTVITATREPVPRAVMSIAAPMWLVSEVPIATTSPALIRRGRAAPSRLACRTDTWIVRNAEERKLKTAN